MAEEILEEAINDASKYLSIERLYFIFYITILGLTGRMDKEELTGLEKIMQELLRDIGNNISFIEEKEINGEKSDWEDWKQQDDAQRGRDLNGDQSIY